MDFFQNDQLQLINHYTIRTNLLIAQEITTNNKKMKL